ncbi:hypothetical protein V7332_30620, partial [Bacillus thuringiensis]
RGPIYRVILDKYKVYQYDNLEVNCEDIKYLTETEKELLDCIITTLGAYSGKSLEKMIQFDLIGKIDDSESEEYPSSKFILEKGEIYNCFNRIKRLYNLAHVSDVKQYSIKVFIELLTT